MKVHKIPGHGFSEIVYKDALMLEAKLQNISVESEKNLKLNTNKPSCNILFLQLLFFLMI